MDNKRMKELIKRVRNDEYVKESKIAPKKSLNFRDMLKITRNLNEVELVGSEMKQNKATLYDQKQEEDKFRNLFNDVNVSIKPIPLEIYDNLVFWGGTIDGVIQFVYKVTPNEASSGVEFNYLGDFSPDNPENDAIVKKIESYYDTFYKYWRNNIM